jgi:DNA-binding sugar fermentation-stimulating protein
MLLLRKGAGAKLQLFYKPLVSSVGLWGLLIAAFPSAPTSRNARGVKKLKLLAEGFPKALIQTLFFLYSLSSQRKCVKKRHLACT